MPRTMHSLTSQLDSIDEYTHRLSYRPPARPRHPHPRNSSRRAQRTSSNLSFSRLSFSTPLKSIRTVSQSFPTFPIQSSPKVLKRANPKRFARRVGEKVGQRWKGYWDCDGVYVGLRDLDLEGAGGENGVDRKGRGHSEGSWASKSLSMMKRSWSDASSGPNRTLPSSAEAYSFSSSPASSRTSSAASASSFKPTILFRNFTSIVLATGKKEKRDENERWLTQRRAELPVPVKIRKESRSLRTQHFWNGLRKAALV